MPNLDTPQICLFLLAFCSNFHHISILAHFLSYPNGEYLPTMISGTKMQPESQLEWTAQLFVLC